MVETCARTVLAVCLHKLSLTYYPQSYLRLRLKRLLGHIARPRFLYFLYFSINCDLLFVKPLIVRCQVEEYVNHLLGYPMSLFVVTRQNP